MAFFKRAKADSAGYYEAAEAATVRENEMTVVKVKGEKVIVTRLQGRLIAFSAICPHAAADLTQGELHRGRVICPDHEYKFDISSGRTLYPPDELYCLKRYPVKEEDGKIKIQL